MNRVGRVTSELQHHISDIILNEIKDPRVGFVTVTAVEVTADLQTARIYFTVLGDVAMRTLCYSGLYLVGSFTYTMVDYMLENKDRLLV